MRLVGCQFPTRNWTQTIEVKTPTTRSPGNSPGQSLYSDSGSHSLLLPGFLPFPASLSPWAGRLWLSTAVTVEHNRIEGLAFYAFSVTDRSHPWAGCRNVISIRWGHVSRQGAVLRGSPPTSTAATVPSLVKWIRGAPTASHPWVSPRPPFCSYPDILFLNSGEAPDFSLRHHPHHDSRPLRHHHGRLAQGSVFLVRRLCPRNCQQYPASGMKSHAGFCFIWSAQTLPCPSELPPRQGGWRGDARRANTQRFPWGKFYSIFWPHCAS